MHPYLTPGTGLSVTLTDLLKLLQEVESGMGSLEWHAAMHSL